MKFYCFEESGTTACAALHSALLTRPGGRGRLPLIDSQTITVTRTCTFDGKQASLEIFFKVISKSTLIMFGNVQTAKDPIFSVLYMSLSLHRVVVYIAYG